MLTMTMERRDDPISSSPTTKRVKKLEMKQDAALCFHIADASEDEESESEEKNQKR